MRITLRQLQCLVAVCDVGQVTAAAARLHLAQPTVSAALSDLERSLGVQLLVRQHARGVAPTAVARDLLPAAREMLRLAAVIEERAAAARDEIVGTVPVGCLVTVAPVVAPNLARGFEDAHPGASVALSEAGHAELLEGLADGRLALVITYDLEVPPEVRFEPLVSLPPYVLLPAGHRLAGRARLRLDEIAEEPLVLLDLPVSREYFLGLFASAGLTPTLGRASRQPDLVRTLVANGYGYTIGNARPAAREAVDGRALAAVPLAGRPKALVLGIAWRADVAETRAAAAFRAHCHAVLAEAG